MGIGQVFDAYNRAEKPIVTLLNPDGTELYSLDAAINLTLSDTLGELKEATFEFPKYDNGVEFEAYDYLISKRRVDIGQDIYIIEGVPSESLDGLSLRKKVKLSGKAFELKYRKLTNFSGTYPFWNPASPSTSLMGKIMQYLPGWTFSPSFSDTETFNKVRTYNVSDTNIYNFLVNEVATAIEITFIFSSTTIGGNVIDIRRKTVNNPTDIYISFENLLKTAEIKELSDEITTSLLVYGAGDLDIRSVNPLGTVKIYDFTYFKTLEWMGEDLIEAITAWENKIALNQVAYANLLTLLKNKNISLTTKQGELSTLNAEYLAIEGVQKARIEAGLSYADINGQLSDKQSQINSKESEIAILQSEIGTTTNQLQAINNLLALETNFDTEQLEQLSGYIIENTYQNDNFIQTDSMTPEEIQEESQKLYDQAKSILSDISVPKYEFDVNMVNFVMLPEYTVFADQFDLGDTISVELETGRIVQPKTLSYSFNYDKPDEFKIIFSDKMKLATPGYVYTDIMNKALKAGNEVKFRQTGWDEFKTFFKADVQSLIDNPVDAGENPVVTKDEEVKVYENGIKGKRKTVSGYNANQMWIQSNTLALTTDEWATSKLGVGEVEKEGETYYGIIADSLVGTINVSNSLNITTENNNFSFSGDTIIMKNPDITVENDVAKLEINDEKIISVGKLNSGGVPEAKYQELIQFTTNVLAADLLYEPLFPGAVFTWGATSGFGGTPGWTITNPTGGSVGGNLFKIFPSPVLGTAGNKFSMWIYQDFLSVGPTPALRNPDGSTVLEAPGDNNPVGSWFKIERGPGTDIRSGVGYRIAIPAGASMKFSQFYYEVGPYSDYSRQLYVDEVGDVNFGGKLNLTDADCVTSTPYGNGLTQVVNISGTTLKFYKGILYEVS